MKRRLIPFMLMAAALLLTGCGTARYAKLEVQVIDQQTREGIPQALLRVYYIKPMLDITYQRQDKQRTDREGFATLTIATNQSQWMILGWTHGIVPEISVEADGYLSGQAGVGLEDFTRRRPLLIRLEKSNGFPSHDNW